MTSELARAESLIRSIPDHPAPGILFRDIMPLLADARALRATTEALISPFEGEFDVVAGVEARGFLLAGAAAIVADVGMMPIRKAGKLPKPAARVSYELEYGEASVEIHDDVEKGARVLLIDDVLATGGTLMASKSILEKVGYECIGAALLFEIEGLGGREAAEGVHLHTVFHS